jgi:hypothetical protein
MDDINIGLINCCQVNEYCLSVSDSFSGKLYYIIYKQNTTLINKLLSNHESPFAFTHVDLLHICIVKPQKSYIEDRLMPDKRVISYALLYAYPWSSSTILIL